MNTIKDLRLETLHIKHFLDFHKLTSSPKIADNMYFSCCNTLKDSKIVFDTYYQAVSFALTHYTRCIGVFSFKPCKDSHEMELSTMLLPEYWGKGYMSAIMKSMLPFAFSTFNIHTLHAYTVSSNLACIQLLENNHFKCIETFIEESIEVKHYIYKIAS